MKMHTINPDGSVIDWDYKYSIDMPKTLGLIVGGPIEYVSVLYNDKPATLVVNEVGASLDPAINPKGQLPPNARATSIYWTATIRGITGGSFAPLGMPLIHGTVVLIEKDKREL